MKLELDKTWYEEKTAAEGGLEVSVAEPQSLQEPDRTAKPIATAIWIDPSDR